MFSETKVEHIELSVANQEFKPKTADMVASIDADTVAYAVASVCESGDDEAGYLLDLDYATEEAIARVKEIQELTGCKDVELHFTEGKNFRFDLTDTYKSNRKNQRTPAGLSELKHCMAEHFNSTFHTTIEADDYVSWQSKYHSDKFIICSPDKDVYNGNRGIHFNYFKRSKGKFITQDIPMTWIKTTELEALVWVHMQVLMGDSSDGIAGLPRCGPAKALKLLAPEITKSVDEAKKLYKDKYKKSCPSEKLWKDIVIKNRLLNGITIDKNTLWSRVIDAYKEYGVAEKIAVLNMRLVNMHQLNKEGDLELWIQPDKEI